MSDLHVVILAAGKGTRMKSSRPKVLHQVAGRPMIDYVLRVADGLKPQTTTIVIGHMKESLRKNLHGHAGLSFVTQEPQLGTGHALLQTAPVLEDKSGTILLLSGDVPLLRRHTLAALLARHEESGAAATVLTAVFEHPYGYGRIIRLRPSTRSGRPELAEGRGRISRIVEERDASPAQRKVKEINSGIFAFSVGPLFKALRRLATSNVQGE